MGKKLYTILSLLVIFATSCKKEETVPTTGTVTIDNTRTLDQTYFVYGFLFSKAAKVSTLETPGPDITIDSDGTNLLFMADNLKNSFFLEGEYADSPSAVSAFDNLKTVNVQSDLWEGLALPLKVNQVWIYRSGDATYAKMRIISLIAEVREGNNYAECTFEWEYQPDGSLTFTGK